MISNSYNRHRGYRPALCHHGQPVLVDLDVKIREVIWVPFRSALLRSDSLPGGTLVGMGLRKVLPQSHLLLDSKKTIKTGMGLVTTITALVLSLLVASAKSLYDTQNIEMNDLSSRVILLDRVLSHYGPESKDARYELRNTVVRTLDRSCFYRLC